MFDQVHNMKEKEIKRIEVQNKCPCQAWRLDATRDGYCSTVAEVTEVTSRETNSDVNLEERHKRKCEDGVNELLEQKTTDNLLR